MVLRLQPGRVSEIEMRSPISDLSGPVASSCPHALAALRCCSAGGTAVCETAPPRHAQGRDASADTEKAAEQRRRQQTRQQGARLQGREGAGQRRARPGRRFQRLSGAWALVVRITCVDCRPLLAADAAPERDALSSFMAVYPSRERGAAAQQRPSIIRAKLTVRVWRAGRPAGWWSVRPLWRAWLLGSLLGARRTTSRARTIRRAAPRAPRAARGRPGCRTAACSALRLGLRNGRSRCSLPASPRPIS